MQSNFSTGYVCIRDLPIQPTFGTFNNKPAIGAENKNHAALKAFIHILIFREIHANKASKYGGNTFGQQFLA
ncbi:hypothetical protein MS6207_03953 [Escherichia coli]|uniref:hypothetical protein n=1 Tax=Escherichia coli TaxID=562 RepID=UPI001586E54D|nr:hypothetical protein [Escherichia coli]NUV19719.1 hypothetical protein [Escherichia coli]